MNRLKNIKSFLKNSGADALLITNINNIRYLTGFSGSNALCIIMERSQYLISDFRYKEQASQEVKGFKLLIAKSSLYEEVFNKGIFDKVKNIAFESENLSFANYSRLKKLFKNKKLIPFPNAIEKISAVKEKDEILMIMESIGISELAFMGLVEEGFEGQTEKDIAFELSSRMAVAGAERNAFSPIVASGQNSSKPHAKPAEKKIKKGEPILIDFGAEKNGYVADITRTLFYGKPGKEFTNIYQIVHDAQRLAIDLIKPGVKCKDIDAAARNYIQKNGFGDYFGHALGHGIGVTSHYQPLISFRSEEILKENMVITIEPGIYIPGKFGIRIEDDILVKKNGYEILTNIDRELIIL